MIEKEKLEAVAIDFADEVKLNANPLEEQINKMNKTFTNVTNNGVGEFDTTMLTTTITAKNSKTSEPETRLITSERDIEVQIDVGMYDFVDGSTNTRQFGFAQNDFSDKDHPKVYSRCPDNFLEFMTDYFTKYNRYPKVNVNVNTYDASLVGEEVILTNRIVETVQGNLSSKYKSARKPMEAINSSLVKQLSGAKLDTMAKIDMTTHHKYIPETPASSARKDGVITATNIGVEFLKEDGSELSTPAGRLVIVDADDTGPSEHVTAADSYDVTYPYLSEGSLIKKNYLWGIVDSSQVTFGEWKNGDGCFGKLDFIMDNNENPTQLIGLTFEVTKKGDRAAIGKMGIDVMLFAGHTADDQQYLYAIEGFMSKDYDHDVSLTNIESDDTNETVTAGVETYQNLRFNFVIEVIKSSSTQPKLNSYMELSKIGHKIIWTGEGVGDPPKATLPFTQSTKTIESMDQDRAYLYETYMHFDESLHLPEIYFPEEPTEE